MCQALVLMTYCYVELHTALTVTSHRFARYKIFLFLVQKQRTKLEMLPHFARKHFCEIILFFKINVTFGNHTRHSSRLNREKRLFFPNNKGKKPNELAK